MSKLLWDTVDFDLGGGVEVYKKNNYYKISVYSNWQGNMTDVKYSVPRSLYTLGELKNIIDRKEIDYYFNGYLTRKGRCVE